MKDSIEKRIKLIKEAEDTESLCRCVCPFYEKGGHPDCVACRKTEADVEECRDYYLERISMVPLDIWDESFDKIIINKRDKVGLDEVVGIGINCDCCYMSDKCPLFKRGYECGIKWDTDKPKNPNEFMEFLINTQYERVKRASVFEKIDGGVPDANLSGEMDRLTDFLSIKDNMGRDRLSINVEASGAAKPDGGGILSKIFGGGSLGVDKPKEIPAKAESLKDSDIETVEYEEVPATPKKTSRKRKAGE